MIFFSWLQLRYENPKQQYLYDSIVVKLSNNFCIANSIVNSQPFSYLTSVSYPNCLVSHYLGYLPQTELANRIVDLCHYTE